MILSRRYAAKIGLAVLSWIAAFPEVSPADLVYFRKGGQAQLPVKRVAGKVSLLAPGGTVEFLDTDFLKIIPDEDPDTEWPKRESAARNHGLNDRFAAAWWALENGLTTRAVTSLREIHSIDPKHEPTAKTLQRLDQVSGPLADPETREVLDALRGRFQQERSPHFLLFHQETEETARERLELLEQVYTTFYLVFAGQGFELSSPKYRLMVAEFRNQAEYVDFLNRGHARSFSTTQGYYHPTLNLVVSFDPTDLATQRGKLNAIDRRSRELVEWESTIDRMPKGSRLRIQTEGETTRMLTQAAAKTWLESVRRDLSRQTLLFDLDLRAIELGVAAHETTHQLIANSGLTRRHNDFPTWLHEGLAAQFEVVRGGRWAGVSRAHDLRLPEWRTIQPAPRLAPILRDQGYGQGYHRDLYAQAWALVYYLRKRHPREFAGFLDLLRSPTPRPVESSSRVLDAFHENLGNDLSKVETDWHRFMKVIKTPLEEGLSREAAPR